MSKTRIFVSSTCYDLAAAREDIRNCLIGLGHEPLLSEYSSFPILPDIRTVENCKKNVREHSDIFVLIVGCKRGSLDTETKKPIVNLEYETAKEQGLDTFVFVNRTVKDLLPVWEANPNADFTARVDYPEVFKFVKGLYADQRWVFPFERTVDITETLRIQLSVFLRDLVLRKRGGKLSPVAEFASESPRVQQIVLDKPKYWEVELTAELLREKLKRAKTHLADAREGRLFRPTKRLSGSEFYSWSLERTHDFLRLVAAVRPMVEQDLVKSWGPLGQPGDAHEIKQAVDKVVAVCKNMTEWEASIHSVIVPDSFIRLVGMMKGWTPHLLEELERIPAEIEKILREPNPCGTYHIQLVFRSPPGIEDFTIELKKGSGDANCQQLVS